MRSAIGYCMLCLVFGLASCAGTDGRAIEESGPLAKFLDLDCGNGVMMKLTLIPAGEFLMGSNERLDDERPIHTVRITKPFYMGIYEVTQAEYEAVTGRNPSKFEAPNKPVETVSWYDAQEFCRKLREKTSKIVRLPTEAEWEYACRAGTRTRFSFGEHRGDMYLYGNYCDKSTTDPYADKEHDDGYATTAPVGSYKPNAWGLYDMHGNVYEWCKDWFAEDYYSNSPQDDPQGPAHGIRRVLRGGHFLHTTGDCRSAHRRQGAPTGLSYGLGFRVIVQD